MVIAATENDNNASPLLTTMKLDEKTLTPNNFLSSAFHRCQNIVKKFGGGKGDRSATCSLVYNIFIKYNSVASLEFMCAQYEPNMPETRDSQQVSQFCPSTAAVPGKPMCHG